MSANRTVSQILRVVTTTTTQVHKGVVKSLCRPQSTKQTCTKQLKGTTCAKCQEDVCKGVKPKKKGFLSGLFTKKKGEPEGKPPKETCKIEIANKPCETAPDLSGLGGQAYKTCGTAYIVQKDKPQLARQESVGKEQLILKKLEASPELKDKQENPMPAFTSVEQRMMDLDERRLHPLYKKYQVTPKRVYKMSKKVDKEYKSRSGPVSPQEYPLHLKFNKELLEKKNLYAEYKKVEPPQQLVAKILEMRQNRRPTLERKFPHLDLEGVKARARQKVYDTLHQKDSITEKYAKEE